MSFKICLIGCGGIAFWQHAPAIKMYESLHKGVVFTACCDIDEEKARAFKEKFGLMRYYTNIEKMLDAEKPQAVSLNTPVELTAELSCLILDKGYPLILEKPPGVNKAETLSMIQTAQASGTPNQVAFNRRYMPLVQKLMELLEKESSEIMDIQYRMLRVGRRDSAFSTTAIHGIDLVRYISKSDYKQVIFRYNALPSYGETVANFHLSGVMESGAVVHLDFLPVSGINVERLEINTNAGLFWLDLPLGGNSYDMPGKLTHIVNNKVKLSLTGKTLSESTEDLVLSGFYHENERFFNALRNNEKPEGDIASGLQSVEIADCINMRELQYIS